MQWPHDEIQRIIRSRKKIELYLLALIAVSVTLWIVAYSDNITGFENIHKESGPSTSSSSTSTPKAQELQQWSSDNIDVLQHLKETENITDQYDIFSDERNPDEGTELLDFDRDHIKYIYPEVINALDNMTDKDAVDWSKYAYVLYATSSHHMCNSMMIFAELRKFNTRAQLVLLVKQEFLTQPDNFTYEHGVLTNFSREYDVKLKPTELIQMGGDSVNIWLSIYMAVSTAYWHTTRKFNEMGNEKILQDYPPTKYGFKPITAKKRAKNLLAFIQDKIIAYLNPETGLLPVVNHNTHSAADEIKAAVNKKNFYTNVYNSLPNYPTLKEFDLTNIVMVIEPTPELFDRVLLAMKNKRKDEYDMELVQYHMFEFFDVIARQQNKSLANAPHISYEERFEEAPEFLILPHQVYGTITSKLNSDTSHYSWMADAHEQIFAHLQIPMVSNSLKAYYDIDNEENVGQFIYDTMKYAHFSDAPIPKAWFWHKPHKWYMNSRTRCPSHPDFSSTDEALVKPSRTGSDCSAGERWEHIHDVFKKTRKSVCGLDLIDTDEDTYYKLIN